MLRGGGTDILFDVESDERRRVRVEIGVHQGAAMRTDLFLMPHGTRLVKTRDEIEVSGVGVVAYADDIQAALLHITPEAVDVIP